MRSLLLVFFAFAMPAVGLQTSASKPMMSVDCNGQMEMNSVLLTPITVDLREAMWVWSSISQRLMQRAKCMCPSTPDHIMSSRFSFFDSMMTQMTSHVPLETDACLDKPEAPTMDWSKLVGGLLRFDMPESCRWQETGKCSVEGIFTNNLRIQIAAEKCYNGMPAFSVHCEGPACDMADFCNSDADCHGSCQEVGTSTDSNFVASFLRDLMAYVDPFKMWDTQPIFETFTKKLTGKAYKGLCMPHEDVVAVLDGILTSTEAPVQKQSCGSTARLVTNIDLKAWDGVLTDGHNAFFDLNAGRYGRTRELDSDDMFAFTCNNELLLPSFGMKIGGLNKIVQALVAVSKSTWTFDPIKYVASMSIWQPSFWLALTTSFPGESQWAPSPNYARCLFENAPSQEECAGIVLAGMKETLTELFQARFDVVETMQWSHWEQFKKVAVTVLGTNTKVLNANVWMEQCKDMPDAFPSFAVQLLASPMSKSLTLCQQESDCTTDEVCLQLGAMQGSDYMGMMLWSGCKDQMLAAVQNGAVSDLMQEAVKKQCSSPEMFYEDLMFLSRSNGENVIQLSSGSARGICVTSNLAELETVFGSPTAAFTSAANSVSSPLEKLNAMEISES
ncbi:hypothetical protein DIPPA_22365 [Diplonema papillatum]|nr:hypothetical protein DIPPA_22365 [Diplonema papillatum]KAJ9453397.1 hypothetical protein DIPPA_22365 [Diplonema papillatum]